jgi:prepilin-type N-terminal cleavage/methylation domain-containing protein
MNSKRGFTLIEMLVVAALIAIGLMILLCVVGVFGGAVINSAYGRMTPEDFSRIMHQEAIQNPVSTGYQFTGCGDGDTIHEGFTGVKNGIPVTGVVCGGNANWGGKGFVVRTY